MKINVNNNNKVNLHGNGFQALENHSKRLTAPDLTEEELAEGRKNKCLLC